MELEYLVVMKHWLKKQKVRLLEEGPLFEFMKSLSHSVTFRVSFFQLKFYREKIEQRDVNPYIDRVLSKFGFAN